MILLALVSKSNTFRYCFDLNGELTRWIQMGHFTSNVSGIKSTFLIMLKFGGAVSTIKTSKNTDFHPNRTLHFQTVKSREPQVAEGCRIYYRYQNINKKLLSTCFFLQMKTLNACSSKHPHLNF